MENHVEDHFVDCFVCLYHVEDHFVDFFVHPLLGACLGLPLLHYFYKGHVLNMCTVYIFVTSLNYIILVCVHFLVGQEDHVPEA